MPALPSRPSTTIARRCAASCTDRTLHRFCQAFTPSASANRGQALRISTALQLTLFAVVTRRVSSLLRRILSVPARSGGGRPTERIPAIPPRLRERVKVPQSGPLPLSSEAPLPQATAPDDSGRRDFLFWCRS